MDEFYNPIKVTTKNARILVTGATGYIGLELVRILSKHPKANILYLCATKNIVS